MTDDARICAWCGGDEARCLRTESGCSRYVLRLTLGDPCEALGCPNDATVTVVDKRSKPWRVCADHRQYFERAPACPDIGSDVPGGGAA